MGRGINATTFWTNISTRTGTATSPGPEEEARKEEGRRESALEGRGGAVEPAGTSLVKLGRGLLFRGAAPRLCQPSIGLPKSLL